MHPLSSQYEVTITEVSNKNNDPSKYGETLNHICTITSAEELSYVLHHIKLFKDTPSYNLNLFKKGISASWEHPQNISGCSWTVQFKAEASNILFERIAIYFCLHGFDSFICNGIKLNNRNGFVKFEIWSADVPMVVDGSDVLVELKDALGLNYPVEFAYKNHKELLSKVSQKGTEA